MGVREWVDMYQVDELTYWFAGSASNTGMYDSRLLKRYCCE